MKISSSIFFLIILNTCLLYSQIDTTDIHDHLYESISSERYLAQLNTRVISSQQYDRSFSRIVGEVVLGSVLGIVPAYLSIAALASKRNNTIAPIVGVALCAGYILGSSYGVYVIAKGGNKRIEFVSTLGFATLGGIIAVVPKLVIKKTDEAVTVISFLSLPLIGALVYANIIESYPSGNVNLYENTNAINSFLTHKDIYSKSILMKLNIIRIEF